MEPFACPHCRFIHIIPDHYAGKKMDCPHCRREIQVPGGAPDPSQDRPTEDNTDSQS